VTLLEKADHTTVICLWTVWNSCWDKQKCFWSVIRHLGWFWHSLD